MLGTTENVGAGEIFSAHLTNPSQDYFTALYNHVVHLMTRWSDYLELYDNEEYIELMNAVAPVFFSQHQSDLIDHIMMAIARLTDPPASGSNYNRRENLSISRLPDCLNNDLAKKNVRSLLSALEKSDDLRRIRDWRNKEGGHNDLLVATGQSVVPKSTIQFLCIKNVLNEIKEIIIESVGNPQLFSYVNALMRGNRHLMHAIKLGWDAAREVDDPHFGPYNSAKVEA